MLAALAQQGTVLTDLLKVSAAQREEQAAQREEQAAQRSILMDLLKVSAAQREEQAAQRSTLADLLKGQAAQRDVSAELGKQQVSLLQQILDRLVPRAPVAARAAAAPDALNIAMIGAPSTSGSDGESGGAGVLAGLSAGGSVRSA